ncbi:MAG: hypothetical protein FIB03_03750 [Anaerolineae bacterium]|nr:hypothetical protein [Anaerolineae bacterium]
MKHQPFEDWLLNEEPITPEQRRELDAHLRSCAYCAALVETGKALRSVRMASPADGFTARFQARLAEQKLVERRRRFWGALWFVLGGLLLLAWFTGPTLVAFFSSPASWIAAFVERGIFLITTLQA